MRIGTIGCMLGIVASSMPAVTSAQVSGKSVNGTDVTLTVNVTASVSAACAFSTGAVPSGSYSVGSVESAYSVDVLFSLRCNSPSRVAIVSENGGLQASDAGTIAPGYARRAPYQITLRLAGDGGSTVQETCQSGTLTNDASGCSFRGPASAARGLRLPGPATDAPGSLIRISSQGYSEPAILVASDTYTDRLTVTISPAT